MIKAIIKLVPVVFVLSGCNSNELQGQYTPDSPAPSANDIAVGGYCDNCGIMYEGMPAIDSIQSETVIANQNEPGDRMEIGGIVYENDGKTPAKNIVLYIYHTDAKGLYTPSSTQTLGKRNGRLRAWVKTDSVGKFRFYTIRPAPYPGGNIPAHIHIFVKEPGKTLYYIDEVWFDDDPFVTPQLRNKAEKRGGDMIIHLAKNQNQVWTGHLKITLGLNIPNYK